MHRILMSLEKDHHNVRRLLDVFDRVLDHGAGNHVLDFGRLREIMQFMSFYVDGYHHKVEEMIHERLVALHTPATAVVQNITQEHIELANKGDEFLDLLRAVSPAGNVISPRGKTYSETLRLHLDTEETTVFPLIEAIMTAEDWDALDTEKLSVSAWADDTIVYIVLASENERIQWRSMFRTKFRDVRMYDSAEALLQEPLAQSSACLVTEVDLPGRDGIALLEMLNTCGLMLPSIVITDNNDVPSAVKAMRAGAVDCLQRPVLQKALLRHVESTINTNG